MDEDIEWIRTTKNPDLLYTKDFTNDIVDYKALRYEGTLFIKYLLQDGSIYYAATDINPATIMKQANKFLENPTLPERKMTTAWFKSMYEQVLDNLKMYYKLSEYYRLVEVSNKDQIKSMIPLLMKKQFEAIKESLRFIQETLKKQFAVCDENARIVCKSNKGSYLLNSQRYIGNTPEQFYRRSYGYIIPLKDEAKINSQNQIITNLASDVAPAEMHAVDMLCCIYGETKIAFLQQQLEQRITKDKHSNENFPSSPNMHEKEQDKLKIVKQAKSIEVVHWLDSVYDENLVRKSKAKTLFLTCDDKSLYEEYAILQKQTSKLDRKTYLEVLLSHTIKNYCLKTQNFSSIPRIELDDYVERSIMRDEFDVVTFIEGILSNPILINQLETQANIEYFDENSISNQQLFKVMHSRRKVVQKAKVALTKIEENFEKNQDYLGSYTNKKTDLKKDATFILDCAEYYIQMQTASEDTKIAQAI